MINEPVVFVILPVFNEAKVLQEVIDEIKQHGIKNIIAIDDGSTDRTFEVLQQQEGVIALRHFLNRGKGAAVKTGMEAAKMVGAEIVVTMDADGQHDPTDIQTVIDCVKNGTDVVLGTRNKNMQSMPLLKIIYNYLANASTWLAYGLWVSDSQSGFRGFSSKALHLIETRTDRYEYDSEVIREIQRHRLRFQEIPIAVRYTSYSQTKQQRQGLVNGIKTFVKMMLSF